MIRDPLSDVLELVEVHGVVSSGIAADGAWVARGPVADHPVKFVAVARGSARLCTDGAAEPLVVEDGEIAILANRAWLELRGGAVGELPHEVDVSASGFARVRGGRTDVVFGGHVTLNATGQALLSHVLPPVGLIRSTGTTAMVRARLDALIGELFDDRMGAAFAIRQLAQLLVLDVLRLHLGSADLPPGVLRVLADDRLRPAVRLMHAEPGRTWRLPALARAAAMSRTAFATRFREVAGMPPLTYLHHWRMLLAKRALREGEDSVGALAAALGYASGSAFSVAFKRETGEPPLHYRGRVRATREGKQVFGSPGFG